MNADSKKKLSQLRKGMGMNYQHHWIVDNMPVSYLYFDLNVTCYKKKPQVTWCYPVESGQKYCATGFPMGCYVDKNGNPKDACVISREYSKKDSYYIFNHVDIDISYHSGAFEDWGKVLQTQPGGRIVCE